MIVRTGNTSTPQKKKKTVVLKQCNALSLHRFHFILSAPELKYCWCKSVTGLQPSATHWGDHVCMFMTFLPLSLLPLRQFLSLILPGGDNTREQECGHWKSYQGAAKSVLWGKGSRRRKTRRQH